MSDASVMTRAIQPIIKGLENFFKKNLKGCEASFSKVILYCALEINARLLGRASELTKTICGWLKALGGGKMTFMSLSGDAFILRTLSYSEADLIVHALSKQHGLLHFFVRGAKKSKKRFSGGVLQPPHLIKFETNNVKPDQLESGALISLKEASLAQDFIEIREDYKSLEAMFSMIKVMLFSETGHEELFNHYGAALKGLSLAENKRRFFTHFVVRYLYIEGVLPEQNSFSDFIRTPMGAHEQLTSVSDQQVEKEVGLANHFLKSYSSSKEGVKWPQ